MDRRGDFSSPASHRKPEHHSNIGDDDISANPFQEEMFSKDQIQEIEQLLSRIGDSTEDHEMLANSFEVDHASSTTGALAAHKSCKHDNMLPDRLHGRDAEEKRERMWRARIADVQTYLGRKKSDTINAILNERRFREKTRQQRHRYRAPFHSQTPKLRPLTDHFSKYDVQADDMTLFIEMRSR
ncbi:hypothetical_protein [Leishmania infantum]|uniref:Hypothetical_protein n=1 Tax=Leishmania infantum TaxID=5671 RepID=A0A6L0XQA8_LEIIN|nr:hypothetical_protein [Leishmania infantum]SUZ42398.1 hypothetical_protein [Leishmania infantum]